MRILVIEDDTILSEATAHRLKRLGHGVDCAITGAQAMALLAIQNYDLVTLDLNLPDTRGEQILTILRQKHKTTPVLVVTARGSVDDRIQLLDLGADDYITKPFDFGELEARIRALLRRSQGQAKDVVTFGDISLDRKACSVTVCDRVLELKQREFRLLEVFMSQPKQVLSKEVLLEHLYGFDESPGPSVIEIYVARLRKTLSGSRVHIRTIRGLGYLLEEGRGE
ncbi:DNA-binding response regulator [Marinomonas piezotolerans]|uniref:DNA-binding response regulator n=1 Tax=Marinomonas piezotolerans TaxID=2213058 RepID=A0A370UEG7_9GAMM|nr:response regulator transcription factor [Marinomonas piezotolerans]RDL46178.1 DNA-binding response regulator [Marinomonas piezotolerans]